MEPLRCIVRKRGYVGGVGCQKKAQYIVYFEGTNAPRFGIAQYYYTYCANHVGESTGFPMKRTILPLTEENLIQLCLEGFQDRKELVT